MVTADCNGFDGSAEKLRKFTTIAETGSSVDPLRLISVSAKAPISGPNLGSVKIPLTSANQLRFRDGLDYNRTDFADCSGVVPMPGRRGNKRLFT